MNLASQGFQGLFDFTLVLFLVLDSAASGGVHQRTIQLTYGPVPCNTTLVVHLETSALRETVYQSDALGIRPPGCRQTGFAL